ncbi:arylsulfatase [Novosphingobium sp. PASSN1]|uniref:arylsulfatase n=1 Tax=Novosphingobium sp. PASSN1 TaxID=2015561 RepID=UPI0025DCD234|nr:arylsulfatase [Novosphingobium sp. PASSN1]
MSSRTSRWLLMLTGACVATLAHAQTAEQRLNLPIGQPAFAGTIAPDVASSRPDWPAQIRAPQDAPNVLVILTDDVGFGATSTFGGPVPTPNFDNLAAKGLRYNQFQTTGVCSPTRAALLTGRNHHEVGMGLMADLPSGYPGYNTQIPPSAATLARVLTLNGYNSAMFGKHHNVPNWEASAAGPFDHWPTGLGFEYFYGFIGGDTDQYSPRLVRNTTMLDGKEATDGKLLDTMLVDDAIGWLHNQNAADPDKPFFIYLAPGSAHAPHQAPADWIARFAGKFDQGWDKLREETYARQRRLGIIPPNGKLTPRPAELRAWSTLSQPERRAFSRMMEVYAGMLAYEDAQIGRLLDEIHRMGLSDNTLILFVCGDNGASAEAGPEGTLDEIGHIANGVHATTEWLNANIGEMGGPKTYQNYPVEWAWAMDTPFQWTKQIASHLGGTRNGFIASWPKRISHKGALRTQFAHVIDIMPTVLDAAGIPQPKTVNGAEQMPVEGISLLPSLAADTHIQRTQYFELAGSRAIYSNGWMASTRPIRMPWEDKPTHPDAGYVWELYDLEKDYSQSTNLAARMPGKLAEMQDLFDREAKRNNVYPIDDRFAFLRGIDSMKAHPPRRSSFSYWGSDVSVMPGMAPGLAGRSFRIDVNLNLDRNDANGVLVASGSWFGGWSFFLNDGVPTVVQSVSTNPADIFRVAASGPLAVGRHKVTFDFSSDRGFRAGGVMRISVDGESAAEGPIARTIARTAGLVETFDVGRDTGVPVTEYKPATMQPDAIERVDVTLR